MHRSPNDVSPTGYEVALAGSYRGQNLLGGLAPQLKVAKPTDRGIPSDYGSWRFSAGVDLILREDDIDDAGGPFDDAGNLVPIGRMAISFVY